MVYQQAAPAFCLAKEDNSVENVENSPMKKYLPAERERSKAVIIYYLGGFRGFTVLWEMRLIGRLPHEKPNFPAAKRNNKAQMRRC